MFTVLMLFSNHNSGLFRRPSILFLGSKIWVPEVFKRTKFALRTWLATLPSIRFERNIAKPSDYVPNPQGISEGFIAPGSSSSSTITFFLCSLPAPCETSSYTISTHHHHQNPTLTTYHPNPANRSPGNHPGSSQQMVPGSMLRCPP